MTSPSRRKIKPVLKFNHTAITENLLLGRKMGCISWMVVPICQEKMLRLEKSVLNNAGLTR